VLTVRLAKIGCAAAIAFYVFSPTLCWAGLIVKRAELSRFCNVFIGLRPLRVLRRWRIVGHQERMQMLFQMIV
jgi:hypothetical protein